MTPPPSPPPADAGNERKILSAEEAAALRSDVNSAHVQGTAYLLERIMELEAALAAAEARIQKARRICEDDLSTYPCEVPDCGFGDDGQCLPHAILDVLASVRAERGPA